MSSNLNRESTLADMQTRDHSMAGVAAIRHSCSPARPCSLMGVNSEAAGPRVAIRTGWMALHPLSSTQGQATQVQSDAGSKSPIFAST